MVVGKKIPIKKGGFTFQEGNWPDGKIHSFDPSNLDDGILNLQEGWLKPKKWNQGGYDTGLVRFVQLTRADEHSFKIEYFSTLLSKLETKKFECKNIGDIFNHS